MLDRVPNDSSAAQEIGFSVPARYNASAILFDNLAGGRGDRIAVTGPRGRRTYRELCDVIQKAPPGTSHWSRG